jgi:hypothetical protein
MLRIAILIIILGLFLQPAIVTAQLAPQLFAGHRAAEYNSLWFKELDKKGKVSLFNFTLFNVDYKDKSNNLYEIYQIGIYNFNKSWGAAGGGRFVGGEFVPTVAISYQKATKDLYFNIFPSAFYYPSTQKFKYSLFGLLFYRPKLNDTWKMFNQITFEPLFDTEQHVYSYQFIRVGLEYKELFQFGIGANLEQIGKDFTLRENYGVFIRKEFK